MSETLATIRTTIVSLIATWGATKIFGIDFYIAYQILTLGQCCKNKTNKPRKKESSN